MQKGIAILEVAAVNVVAIDAGSTSLSGDTARIAIILAKELSTDDASLGYKIIQNKETLGRVFKRGSELTWKLSGRYWQAVDEFVVPPGSIVYSVASYHGAAQNFWWQLDPHGYPNARYSVYSSFDDELKILRDFLTKAGTRVRDARDLESGTSWLLWMMGFSVAHLGGTDKTQDAVDLIAITPYGHLAVIECTTGLLKTDKVGLLNERTIKARNALVASGNSHLRVLSVFVTSRSRDEIAADLPHAERNSILVLTRENLLDAIERAFLQGDAEQFYQQAEQTVAAAAAKYISPEGEAGKS